MREETSQFSTEFLSGDATSRIWRSEKIENSPETPGLSRERIDTAPKHAEYSCRQKSAKTSKSKKWRSVVSHLVFPIAEFNLAYSRNWTYAFKAPQKDQSPSSPQPSEIMSKGGRTKPEEC